MAFSRRQSLPACLPWQVLPTLLPLRARAGRAARGAGRRPAGAPHRREPRGLARGGGLGPGAAACCACLLPACCVAHCLLPACMWVPLQNRLRVSLAPNNLALKRLPTCRACWRGWPRCRCRQWQSWAACRRWERLPMTHTPSGARAGGGAGLGYSAGLLALLLCWACRRRLPSCLHQSCRLPTLPALPPLLQLVQGAALPRLRGGGGGPVHAHRRRR